MDRDSRLAAASLDGCCATSEKRSTRGRLGWPTDPQRLPSWLRKTAQWSVRHQGASAPPMGPLGPFQATRGRRLASMSGRSTPQRRSHRLRRPRLGNRASSWLFAIKYCGVGQIAINLQSAALVHAGSDCQLCDSIQPEYCNSSLTRARVSESASRSGLARALVTACHFVSRLGLVSIPTTACFLASLCGRSRWC